MKRRNGIALATLCLGFVFCSLPDSSQAQQTLLFGTIKAEGRTSQARFEVDSLMTTIVYAPYGRTPLAFTNIKVAGRQLVFNWQYNKLPYRCTLVRQEGKEYKGTCSSNGNKGAVIEMTMRDFSPEDAQLQGNSLKPTATDLQILDRALTLLNNGNNWSRSDNRICDTSAYPYKWSLFCALHQASIDVGAEYRHLRPAIQAARQAINEATSGKQFSHMLQDFNKEAVSFESIAGVLNRAKEIIREKIQSEN